ncbi:MAG: bifunctional hydroxymethylpyrimidine kinase/phosphomethylpyrimidine kinase [Candidatus Brocadiales bacterium]
MHKVLIIAGSDSGGGAGMQADLKTLMVLGVFGTCVVTAITAQNTLGVQNTYEIPDHVIAQQIDSVMTDIGTDALKTGMLCNGDIVKVVSNKIKQYEIANVVVDPVMAAKGGTPLLSPDGVNALISDLIPLAFLITPNIYEAERLCGLTIKSISDMEESAKLIHKLGAKNILIKGGHLVEGKDIVTDVLYGGRTFEYFSSERIKTKNTHGIGCTYASAIATGLAKGKGLMEAIKDAKSFIAKALRASHNPGKGHGTLNQPGANMLVDPRGLT